MEASGVTVALRTKHNERKEQKRNSTSSPLLIILPLLVGSTHFPQISPPMPLNFSMNATIFWNTLCFFVTYSG